MPNVYITAKIPDDGTSLLRKKGYQVDVNESGRSLTKSQLSDVFARYEAVITMIFDIVDEEVLKAAKSLKIIANFAVGFDNIDVLEAKKRGIVVANTPGVASQSVAEHTMMLILACQKKLILADRFVRSGKFQRWDSMNFLSPQIFGKTIGIIGLGRIGTAVGKMAYHGLAMKILYHDVVRSEDFELLCEAKPVSLHALLAQSDFVTLHVPLNSRTDHLMGRKQFETMKHSAIFINTSRGRVVDEGSLIWALTHDAIAGAGLDVFEHEPQVGHELTTLPNVVLTPHIGSATIETRESTAKIAAENIIAVFEGKTPFGLVKVS